jgi:plasmid stability protein
MATLTVRDISDETLSQLKTLAAASHRSLNGQVLHVLQGYADTWGPVWDEVQAMAPAERARLRDWLLKGTPDE